MGAGALATKANIAKTNPIFGMSCDICGALEDSDTHALFECPLAVEIWRGSDFEQHLWWSSSHSAADSFSLMFAARSLEQD